MGSEKKSQSQPTLARLVHGLSTHLMTIQINMEFLRRYIPKRDRNGNEAYSDLVMAVERSISDFKSLRDIISKQDREIEALVEQGIQETRMLREIVERARSNS